MRTDQKCPFYSGFSGLSGEWRKPPERLMVPRGGLSLDPRNTSKFNNLTPPTIGPLYQTNVLLSIG
jgi:hypothetical protein